MNDVVLEEIWMAKDELAAECGHDINTLFQKLEEKQKTSRQKYVYPKAKKTESGS